MPELSVASPPKLLLGVVEVAEVLGCGRTFVYALIASGELVPMKLGKLTKIPLATVEEFVARRTLEAARALPQRLPVGRGAGVRGSRRS